ncbi:dihydroxyacetone kinase phosphoryl donor subunit DhaM [uncultured Tessaracoccus sp.]|uniref:dihydroxyacetone kinase phosphoryl donor subunit DhaM n=1 Tax=uncultured Tessaracoccus sp. TaxID=905023 RepID=UPI0025FD38D7|nr:dihydroxyacetone kinase phosphoryl donor subunit DhaM [uncultured Tessaracoccus sp.]
MTVGIVVVSHSDPLARAALDLARVMVHGEMPPVAVAAGLPDGRLGTDTTEVMRGIEEVQRGDGVVILADMGSAIMGAETAIDLLEAGPDVRVAAAPLVEGLTAALVLAAAGAEFDEVVDAAERAMQAKLVALGRDDVATGRPDEEPPPAGHTAEVELTNEVGLHARPASRMAALTGRFESDVRVRCGDKPLVDARSTMSLMALGAKQGDVLHLEASGPDAEEALAALVQFVADGLGDRREP